ncbi:hypothetical protein AMS68_001865 [Peltaster fructicola]|uniref:Uncharacterized protein n=1 Tax=Peltaster fructicola TaxID=286661 RepID=A0A6H0XNZ3_9PEZI|nr:hypothetical protein AMS68_001865 [Peltaster fructicola]
MHLLEQAIDGRLTFFETEEEDFDTPYAILSHTWGRPEEEVTYQDVISGKAQEKPAYAKITFLLEQAKKDKLNRVWIDTCCINKYNASELGESINLMYQWYAKSKVCYVFLSDVNTTLRGPVDWQIDFCQSRWFKRGWTLQELIAPSRVEFFDRTSRHLGSRETLSQLVYECSGIPPNVLHGASLDGIPFPQRLTWMSERKTMKSEDVSYCLLGLMEISLPFNYGEGGTAARQRLFKEIERKHGQRVADELRLTSPQDLKRPVQSQDNFQPGELVELLTFDHMGSRHAMIEHAFPGTCIWLSEHSAYQEWLRYQPDSSRGGLLWIKGHPGAGKSTLLKYIDFETARLETPDTIQVSFYFNARGSALQKSTTGMYRSLLVQIFDQLPHIEEHVYRQLKLFQRRQSSDWAVYELKEMLQVCMNALQRWHIRCFVDALDECETKDVQDMIYFFKKLGRAFHLSVCFASRYYPALSIKGSVEIRVEEQEQHKRDLEEYIRDHLDVEDDPAGAALVQQLSKKANGVFMWAVLVVKLTNEELARGMMHKIQDVIASLPQKLDGVYRDIINRRQADNVEHFRICMQLILFSSTPLTGHELYCAMASALTGDLSSTSSSVKFCQQTSMKDIDRFITSASRGLAEVVDVLVEIKPFTRTMRTVRVVHVIHESVRDFFLGSDGLHTLFPDIQGGADFLECWCHDRLKLVCWHYLEWANQVLPSDRADYDHHVHKNRHVWCEEYRVPFFQYAAANAVFHAEQAARCISQAAFISATNWSSLTRAHEALQLIRPCIRPGAQAIHVIASYGAKLLLHTAIKLGHDVNCSADQVSACMLGAIYEEEVGEKKLYRLVPLWAAVYARAFDCCDLLLDHGARADHCVESGLTPLHWLVAGMSALYSDNNHAHVLRLIVKLLSLGADVNAEKIDSHPPITPPLLWASTCRATAVAKLLLEHGANVHAVDTVGRTPLQLACYTPAQSLDMVMVLMEYGARADVVDEQGRSLIDIVVEASLHSDSLYGCGNWCDHAQVVRFFLDQGSCAVVNHGFPDLYCPRYDCARSIAEMLRAAVDIL